MGGTVRYGVWTVRNTMPESFKKSPDVVKWLYKLFLRRQTLSLLNASFDQEYRAICEEKGRKAALLWYWSQLLVSFPPIFMRTLKWRSIMIKNYLKIALRNILKYKGYSFINVAGLAMGMACCILILAYIVNELSFDKFHERADDIYRIATRGIIVGRTIEVTTVQAPMGPTLVQDFPEVLNAVRFRRFGNMMFSYEDKRYFESGFLYADQSLFDVFSFRLIQGDPATALEVPYTMVVTPEIAQKYFSGEDPVGKIIKMNNDEDFTVTGVIEKPPSNSHFTFDMLGSFETLYKRDSQDMAHWAGWNFQTYVLLQQGIDAREFNKKFVDFNEKYAGDIIKLLGGELTNYLQPLTSIHLHSNMENELGANSDVRYVYTFTAIAVFILIIACINFMNLSTARSANRAREVGLRKVVGAERGMLINQFLGESFFLAVVSVLIALALVRFVQPYFSNLAGQDIDVSIVSNPWIAVGLFTIVLFVGFLAGSYPAFFLSGFKPASVLKGELQKGAKHSRFRSILVVFQFAISITLIIGTIVVMNQLNYMRNKRLGFNKEQQLVIPIRGSETSGKLEIIKSEMSKIAGVLSTCGSGMVPGEEYFNTEPYYPEGFDSDQSVLMQNFYIDDDFLETMGVELAMGRGFSKEMATDAESAVLINETAAKRLEWGNPVGKTIYMLIDSQDFSKRRALTVIGVIKDIHHRSVHHVVEPTLIDFSPDVASRITLKLNSEGIPGTMERIRKKWYEIAPHHAFDYFFLDDFYDGLYRSEERLGRIIQSFTLFAIIIGCLGLFGLASYAAEQRTKEVGIRKVLGSSAGSIVLLLCREFIGLVVIANVLAWPVAFFMMKKWLQSFPYQAGMRISTYLLAGALALVIALLTVSYRAFKAAWTNPVEALRYE